MADDDLSQVPTDQLLQILQQQSGGQPSPQPAATPSGAPPTTGQQWLASPGARLLRSDVIDPVLQATTIPDWLGKQYSSVGGLFPNMVSDYFGGRVAKTADLQKKIDQPFIAANAAAQNLPGYNTAARREAQINQRNPPGFASSLLPDTMSAVRGLATYAAAPIANAISGDPNAPSAQASAQAAMNAETAGQQQFARQHPALAGTAGLLGAAASSAPEMAALPPERMAPSLKSIFDDAGKFYSVVDNAVGGIKGSALEDVANTARAATEKAGFDPELHPSTNRILTRLNQAAGLAPTPPGTPAINRTFQGMDTLGQVASNAVSDAYGAGRAKDAMLAGKVQKGINDFVFSLPENLQHIIMPPGLQRSASGADYLATMPPGSGPPPDVEGIVTALKNARDAWTRASKGGIIQNAIDKAMFNAETKNSLSAAGDQLVQEFRKIHNSSLIDQFNPAEQQAIRQVATGNMTDKILRTVGQLSPNRMWPLFGEAVMGILNPAHAPLITGGAAAAFAAKGAAGARTARAAEQAAEMVKTGKVLPKAPSALSMPSLSGVTPAPILAAIQKLAAAAGVQNPAQQNSQAVPMSLAPPAPQPAGQFGALAPFAQ